MIRTRHPRVKLLILVNDPCDLDVSIKDSEHDRRNAEKTFIRGTKNLVIRTNDGLPSSKDFNDFFKNKSNKIRLQQFFKAQFTAEAKTLDCDVIYSIQDKCCRLVTGQRKEYVECHHMEADTIIFYIYAKLKEKGELITVIIVVEYTNVVVLAAHVAHEIPGVLGKCMAMSILLEIHFDLASIYSLFYKSILPKTYLIFLFLRIEEEKSCI